LLLETAFWEKVEAEPEAERFVKALALIDGHSDIQAAHFASFAF